MPAILQAVERARALPPEEYPAVAGREQDQPQVQLITGILQAWDDKDNANAATSLIGTTRDFIAHARWRSTAVRVPQP